VRGDDIVHVDARPSDSIAIALRLAAPIFAPESLLTAVAADSEEGEEDTEISEVLEGDALEEEQRRMSAQDLKEHLENLRPEDFGKFNL